MKVNSTKFHKNGQVQMFAPLLKKNLALSTKVGESENSCGDFRPNRVPLANLVFPRIIQRYDVESVISEPLAWKIEGDFCGDLSNISEFVIVSMLI